ncbi:F-box/LRR-repeat protein At4g14096 [Linum grandiflorum]
MNQNRKKSDSSMMQLGMTVGGVDRYMLLLLILILLLAWILRAMTNKKESSCKQLGFAGGVVDRISNLPDSIIHHILSFLDTDSAVQTCLLSKQWESTWKHVHSLNLNLKFDEYSRYEMFVDKVLSLRHPFHVSKVLWHRSVYSDAHDGCEFSLLRRLVQYAVSHGAQHFDVRPIYCNELNTPRLEWFDSISDTVRSLKLRWFDLDCRPICSAFRLLTTLELDSCRFLTDRELVEPFSQFPCLKDLVMDGCSCSWVSEADADRPVRLRVSGLELVRFSLFFLDECKIELFAPNLKYFGFTANGNNDFSELTVPSLVHADIRALPYCPDEGYDINKEHLVFMFRGLHNVESLTLCTEVSEVLTIVCFTTAADMYNVLCLYIESSSTFCRHYLGCPAF